MRFLPPLAALADGPVRFDGDEQAYARPMGPLLAALTALGVETEAVTGTFPSLCSAGRGWAAAR